MDADSGSDPDRDLMHRIAGGDREAFARLYDIHGASVMGFLFRLCADRQLAEDLTQETFLRAWRAAPRWRPLARVSTWLYLIARRLWWNASARRRLRRERSRAGTEGQPGRQQGQDREPEPLERLARLEAAAAVQAALGQLSPRLRVVFVLLRLEGRSLRETAQIAGVPIGTAKSRAAAAELALRRLLDP